MGRRQKSRLGVETLENRRLLAVTVLNTDSGDLLIAGDSADDSITVIENELGTQWEILGHATPITPLVADVDPVRPGLQIPKPTTQDVFILLDGGADSLTMLGINQGFDHGESEVESEGPVTFVGQTTIEMGSETDTVNLGGRAGSDPNDFILITFPPVEEGDPILVVTVENGANDFIGAVSVDLGGGDLLAIAADTGNELNIVNTNFGRSGTEETPPVAGHLEVRGAVGVDTVMIHDSNNFGGSFDINTGGSDDVVRLGPDTNAPPIPFDAVTLGGNLNVSTGDGADTITLSLALTGGNITVHGGAGDDTIRLGSPANTPPANRVGSSARGHIIVQGGDGADTVAANQATTVGGLHLALGGGNNSLDLRNSSFSGSSSIAGGVDIDSVNLTAVNSPVGLHIQTAGGNDSVRILGTLVELGVASILTGPGNDTVQIGGGSRFATLIMVTGDGNDSVSFGNSPNVAGNASVENFFLDLGAGDDHVDSGDSRFGRAFVQGGSGANTRAGQTFGQDNEDDFLFFEGFAA
ncbi:MAG: hypothetical protein WD894_20110 [Pirellulales bacterium]